MAQNRMQLVGCCCGGRQLNQPGESRSVMYRCATLLTVQTTLVVVLFLIGGVLVLDSYKWRQISIPWFSGLSEGPNAVLQQGNAAHTLSGAVHTESVDGKPAQGTFTSPTYIRSQCKCSSCNERLSLACSMSRPPLSMVETKPSARACF